jgi:myosin heavy subunit
MLHTIDQGYDRNQDLDDMIGLNDLSEASVLENLRQRYVRDKIYVSLI